MTLPVTQILASPRRAFGVFASGLAPFFAGWTLIHFNPGSATVWAVLGWALLILGGAISATGYLAFWRWRWRAFRSRYKQPAEGDE